MKTGTSPHGQGHETSWSQIVADGLGVDPDEVEVLHGDTAITPLGMDTYGSRSLSVGGVALHFAMEKIKEKARTIAAHELEVSEDDLEWTDGALRVKGAPDKARTIPDLAVSAWHAHDLPAGVEPHLNATAVYDPPNFTWPAGAHICVVEVDTETGATDILRVRRRRRLRHRDQPDDRGGAGARRRRARRSPRRSTRRRSTTKSGNLTTSSMTQYLVPTAVEIPAIITDNSQETPSTTNPLGVKGIGEAGTIASPPAVINAVVDAVSHLGVTDVGKPASPERVWRAIQDAQGRCGMIPAPFEYARAESVDHAIELLGSNEDAKILAGGHSLLPLMRVRFARPSMLVDIGRIGDLSVRPRGRRRRRDRRADPPPRRGEQRAAAGARARSWRTRPAQIGDPQVRHMGTIGGSVAHADPASDMPTVMLALGAQMVVRGAGGQSRTVAAADFFQGLFTADLAAERGADRGARARRPPAAGAT